jgi:23S rRNA (adenine2030-N6)-methyltransferase
MNYRHVFHAGNFADVHKHVVLLALLDRLMRKPKPLLYLDTHAGRGSYDLRSPEATRGDEWRDGVERLRGHVPQSEDVRRYCDAIAPALAQARYPGSPLLAISHLREGDRAVFIEKQLEEAYALQQSVRNRRGISVVHGDGYAALKTYLPPREGRGLVMIDPAYESQREFADALRGLTFGLQRWATGVFALWYPIKATTDVARFHSALEGSGLRKRARAQRQTGRFADRLEWLGLHHREPAVATRHGDGSGPRGAASCALARGEGTHVRAVDRS